MTTEPKVSILSPCYNGEEHLEYFLKSLSEQTYKNVEFILIDDGSTDNSRQIYENHKQSLINNGWTTQYIYQKKPRTSRCYK